METEEEQDLRMMQLPNGSGWPWRRTKKEDKTGEDGSYHTAQVGPGDRGRKKSKKWIGFDLDLLTWMEFSKIKNSRSELTRPVIGTIFLVYFGCAFQGATASYK